MFKLQNKRIIVLKIICIWVSLSVKPHHQMEPATISISTSSANQQAAPYIIRNVGEHPALNIQKNTFSSAILFVIY
uniref:Putative secreted protein n=1 Tax=Ixodes ricinus TaxID=34613 RepID=A0A6B0U3V9_IXORI